MKRVDQIISTKADKRSQFSLGSFDERIDKLIHLSKQKYQEVNNIISNFKKWHDKVLLMRPEEKEPLTNHINRDVVLKIESFPSQITIIYLIFLI